MRRSHEAVSTERARPSQARTIVAARTATCSAVAWMGRPAGAAPQRDPGGPPAHRAVLGGDDRVRELHAAERLGAEVGARAAAAVDDDRRVQPLRSLGGGQAPTALTT